MVRLRWRVYLNAVHRLGYLRTTTGPDAETVRQRWQQRYPDDTVIVQAVPAWQLAQTPFMRGRNERGQYTGYSDFDREAFAIARTKSHRGRRRW